ERDLADFAGGEHQRAPAAFFISQPGVGPRGAAHLAAATRGHLDVVYVQAGGDRLEQHRVAHLRVDRGAAGNHRHAVGQTNRRQDVALEAVGELDERDVAAAVGVVLDADDLGGQVDLVA